MKKKLIRITTIPYSIIGLLGGQLRFMSNFFDVLAISSKGENAGLQQIAELEEVPCLSVEMTRKITPLKDLMAVYNLYRIFKKEKPFIVHSHTPKAGTVSMLAARLAGVPHRLHTIAGLPLVEASGFKRKLLNTVERITYKCATKIYPNSFGLVDIILDNKFTNKEKLKVIANGSSNGIDTTYFDPKTFENDKKQVLRADLKISDEDFVFVFAGRLVTDKGINELIAVFNRLCHINTSIKLLLVGTYENELDPLKPGTLEIIDNNSKIITTGWVDDVRPLYSISNVLVFPSYREGFPNVVMQAAAMQLPCIVTNINGCNEIIKHGAYGHIVPVKDEIALFEAMDFFLKNQEKGEMMGIKSREHIKAHFERKVVWKALLEEYKQLQ